MSERSSHKSAPALPPTESGSHGTHKSPGGDGSGSTPKMGSSDGQMTVISSRVPVPSLSIGRGQPPLESGSLLEGERLGQFLLEKFVGGGGMGVVFRALDTTLNREVAVKVLSRNQSADEETLRRFRNEAQSAARLNHENIAHVHYVGEDRGVHYIVFEFIEGVNIRDLVERNGPLPLEDALSYCYQIAQALEHASQRAVIHRDIKPSNVLITLDGKAKLVDMGLARLNQVAQADNDLTASGVTLGTFDYISPEQARDPRSADVRSDLYSLGCSFFYMLTGRPPFPDGTVLQKLLQHQADHPPDPRAVRPELPPDVTRILARLLAKNPAHRYQQPGELIDDLSALGDKLGVQLSSSRPHWSPARGSGPMASWRQHVPWVVPLALLFVIVIALDFYWSNENTEPVHSPPRPSLGRVTPSARSKEASQPPARQVDNRPSVPSAAPPTVPPAATNQPLEDRDAGVSAKTSPVPPASKDTKPFWERVLEPFGAGKLNELKDRVTDSTKERLEGVPPSNDAIRDATDDTVDLSIGEQTSADSLAPTPAPTTTPQQVHENLLVVGDDTAPRSYASLHAACGDAKNGDIIELRFSGRRVEKPINISNIKLTIRAGEGFQPVVAFHPDSALVPLKYPQTMLSLVGSQLYVTGVQWELDLPRNVPPDWALFEIRRCEIVQFQRCAFTISNSSLGQTAYHAGVAFFDIKAPPGAGSMSMGDAVDDQMVTINLQHCLARGEATFLRTAELQPVRLNWDNGLLATSERLLVTAGGPSQSRQLGRVQITLRHVTAMVQLGLVLLVNSDDAPYQLATEIHCDDCILATGARSPLVEQRGSDSPQEYETRLRWSGNRDYFAGFDVFWQIVSSTTQTVTRQMRFEAWQGHWTSESRGQWSGKDSSLWRELPATDRPFHIQTATDYALNSDLSRNPALVGASDGTDAGCQLRQLPPLAAADQSED